MHWVLPPHAALQALKTLKHVEKQLGAAGFLAVPVAVELILPAHRTNIAKTIDGNAYFFFLILILLVEKWTWGA